MLLGPQCLPVPELYVRLPVGLSRHLSGRQPGSTQVTVLARLCQDVQVHAAKLRPLMVQSPHPLSQMPVLAKSTSRPRQMILELVQPLPHGQGLVDACVRWREALHADTLGSEPTPHVQWDLELQTDVDCGHVILAQHLSKRVLHVLLEVDTLLRDGRDALLEGSESHQLVQCLGQVLHLSRRDAQASRIDNGSVPCVPTEDIDDTLTMATDVGAAFGTQHRGLRCLVQPVLRLILLLLLILLRNRSTGPIASALGNILSTLACLATHTTGIAQSQTLAIGAIGRATRMILERLHSVLITALIFAALVHLHHLVATINFLPWHHIRAQRGLALAASTSDSIATAATGAASSTTGDDAAAAAVAAESAAGVARDAGRKGGPSARATASPLLHNPCFQPQPLRLRQASP
mmetsp:Transcript_97124/g.313035  ORF Transcript_97124/g.313035 Transcript_97124/m.313035 type:complete len:407 (-) Transcript_97124:282-1502(-)